MPKRIVRADGVRVIRCVGVPGVENGVAVRCDGNLVDITEQGTATQGAPSQPGVPRASGGAQSHRQLRLESTEQGICLLGLDFSNP